MIQFQLGTQFCSSTTGSTDRVIPPVVGSLALDSVFAGSATFTPASATTQVNVLDPMFFAVGFEP